MQFIAINRAICALMGQDIFTIEHDFGQFASM
jgi:hypothetical protein